MRALLDTDYASVRCCEIGPVTEEDVKEIYGALRKYETAAVNAFNTLKWNIAALNETREFYQILQELVINFIDPLHRLHSCLVQGSTRVEYDNALNSIGMVEKALTAVLYAFKHQQAILEKLSFSGKPKQ